MRWLLFALLGGVVLWLFGPKAVAIVVDASKRGRKITTSTMAGGVVVESPAELAAAASRLLGRPVTRDAYALARMIRSEAGSGNAVDKAAVAHVALSDAREHGWSLFFALTVNRNRGDGLFGEQRGGRYATSRDPYENDLAVAEAVLSGEQGDPTGGATKFVHVSAFGVQPGTTSYDAVATKWAADGLVPREVPGASSDLRVFVRA